MYSGMRSKWPTASRSVVADQLHGVGGQAGFGGRFGQDLGDRRVRMDRLFAAAEDHGVAALTHSAAASAVTFGRDS